jgi:hypothetical protein
MASERGLTCLAKGDFSSMIGQTISHYGVIEKLVAVAWGL